jgi:hypothetical protein
MQTGQNSIAPENSLPQIEQVRWDSVFMDLIVPTSSSWLNLVERFFGELTADVVREGSFQSARELIRAIESYLADRNRNPKKYVWRASGIKILEKIRRAREAPAAAEIIYT